MLCNKIFIVILFLLYFLYVYFFISWMTVLIQIILSKNVFIVNISPFWQVTSTPLTTSQNLNIPNRITSANKTPPGAPRGTSQHHQHQSPTTPTRMSILTNKPTILPIKVPNVACRLAQSKLPPNQSLPKVSNLLNIDELIQSSDWL